MSKRMVMKTAPRRPDLDKLLKEVREPTERELREQQKSWTRQDRD